MSRRATEAAKKLTDITLHLIDNQISPLHRVNYKIQLKDKQRLVEDLIKRVSQKLKVHGLPIKTIEEGVFKPVSAIIASPEIYEYRNKDDFSIWTGKDGKEKVVGFLSGSPKYDTTYCIPANKVLVSKQLHKNMATAFQDYLRNVSPFGVCIYVDPNKDGNWRRLICRSNRENQLMATAIFHPKKLFPGEIYEEKQKLASYFEKRSTDLGLHSLYFQACRRSIRCNRIEAPFQLLFGEKYIYESLNGVRYRISPDSFFQINTAAAELLSNCVLEKLNVDKHTVIVDLYCGVGTFSLQIASKVSRVIGIEENFQAVQDAYANAQINNIKNCLFIEGKVNVELPKILNQLRGQHIVVIANPSREGLTNDVITYLREDHDIDQLVFISCNPIFNASDNLIHLCRPFMPRDNVLGANFMLTHTVPIDLFPHTNHVEVAFFLSRNKDVDLFL